jgi:hypothetical protein
VTERRGGERRKTEDEGKGRENKMTKIVKNLSAIVHW